MFVIGILLQIRKTKLYFQIKLDFLLLRESSLVIYIFLGICPLHPIFPFIFINLFIIFSFIFVKYAVILLEALMLMSCRFFFSFSLQTIIWSVYGNNFVSSFPILESFISFSCLSRMTTTARTIWMKVRMFVLELFLISKEVVFNISSLNKIFTGIFYRHLCSN